ncbi:MAG: YihA family ribosome biogenesis GTP-binding protein [Flammeovirgaceae bacterium]|nr:MAG: YihA family ribosome biogenesis GTP-binding protein [Flammeovirgaceae bacterium]
MRVTEAEFSCSATSMAALPKDGLPEFAVIGRSNVGKSSLINLLTGRKQLAKISATPGKTQTINHYLINESWYLVDLPGYGYARVSKQQQQGFGKLIEMYLTKSSTLFCLFVLLDCRLKPQPIDLDFITWAGKAGIPLALVFTKADKVTKSQLKETLKLFETELLKQWESLPPVFITSSLNKTGGKEILAFIASALKTPAQN